MSVRERVPLRQLLVALETGSRPKGGVKGIESGVPSLGGEHLDGNGGFRLERVRYVPREFAASMRRGRIAVGDVLVVKDGATTGKVALVRDSFPYKDAVVNEHLFLCRCDERVDPRYVFWYLFSAQGQREILTDFRGAAQGGISQRFADLVQIPFRPREEQHQIVAEIEKQFSRLDEAVANLKRVKANFKRYKAAVLKAAVEGRLVPTEAELARRDGRRYETGGELLSRILQERRRAWNGKGAYRDPDGPEAEGLPPLPEGWVWARLEAVAALKGGITVDKKRRDPTARAVAYLRVANVQRGYLDMEEIKTIEAPEAVIEELRLQPGDVLFNEGGDRDKLGRGWIWEGQIAECIHQNHVFRARPYSTDISGKLISWWANTFGKDYFLREGKQTTNLASINMTKLSAFPVPVAPLAEQYRIVAEVDCRLSIVREVEAEVDANLKRAQALRQAALARAFAGATDAVPSAP